MPFDWQDLATRLDAALGRHDRAAVEAVVAELAGALDAGVTNPCIFWNATPPVWVRRWMLRPSRAC